MLPAIFFDMDGVLIDSEPAWQQSEITIFGALGLDLSVSDTVQTKGMRIDEVARHWYAKTPWDGPRPDDVAAAIVDDMVGRIRSGGTEKPYATDALRAAREATNCLAIVSSSAHRLIDAVVERLGLEAVLDFRVSGEDVRHGTPHPEIYLAAAERAGVESQAAWVVEDSFFGVLAAKAARMRCIAVPEEGDRNDPRFSIADEVRSSLEGLDVASWQSRR